MNIEKEKYEEIIKCLYSARISLMNFSCIVSEYISIYYAMELQNDISIYYAMELQNDISIYDAMELQNDISIYDAMELQNDISNLIWIEKELRELKGRLDYE